MSLKIDVNKVKGEKGRSYDEEAGEQHHSVSVTFVFADTERRVEREFSSGETALGMKKQLFDALGVAYGKMVLEVDGEELIDPLSICDSPKLKEKKELEVIVKVPDMDSDKWQNAKWD